MKRYALVAALLFIATAAVFATRKCSPQEEKPIDNGRALEASMELPSQLIPTYAVMATETPYTPSEPPFTYEELLMVAKTVWGEARGCSPEEQRLVVWTILQRVDAGGEFRNLNTIEDVILRPNAFIGYSENNPINTEIYDLSLEVLTEWQYGAAPPTHEIYAPTAPYYFFDGDGTNNWFREEW